MLQIWLDMEKCIFLFFSESPLLSAREAELQTHQSVSLSIPVSAGVLRSDWIGLSRSFAQTCRAHPGGFSLFRSVWILGPVPLIFLSNEYSNSMLVAAKEAASAYLRRAWWSPV